MKIAMWSGPRNLSTAMMYSFGARSDCVIWDEPFYASYLAATGLDHPMRTEILAKGEQSAAIVAKRLAAENPDGKQHFYQKHMTQHMIKGVDRGWMNEVKNIFLIRHPARVIASYDVKRQGLELDDIGFWQQAELFEQCENPVVIDSHDIREQPEAMLRLLCSSLEIGFDPAMLSWPSGGHKDDGVWAKHWYGAVHKSTGFSGAEPKLPEISPALQPVLKAALPFYRELEKYKLAVK